MKHIDVTGISKDPSIRLQFLTEFVGFTDDDWQAIRDSAAVLGPVLPGFLDALYEHLLSYDDTRKAFVQAGGDVDADYMAMRKEHLTQWVLRMVAGMDSGPQALASYLINIGKKHTTTDGDPGRAVAPRYMVALTGFIQSGMTSALFQLLPGEPDKALRMSLAWNKLLVIQLELFLSTLAPSWPNWDEKPAK